MRNFILVIGFMVTLASCGNGSGGTGSDSTTNPSDTSGRNINPALEDPNSNMADTMRMKDSVRVKDTAIKDHTSVKPRKQ